MSINKSIDKWGAFSDTKNHSPRSLVISTFLAVALQQHIGKRTSGPLFPARTTGAHQNPATPAARLKSMLDKLNVVGSPHVFRHTNSTLMDELGVPSKVKKDRLGHSTRSDITLGVYTHHGAQIEAETAEKISEALLTLVKDEEPVDDSAVHLEALKGIMDSRMRSLLGDSQPVSVDN